MHLLIDDIRELRCDVVARTYDDGFKLLEKKCWTLLLLDHDLGPGADGYQLIKEAHSIDPDMIPGRVEIVSSNPVGVQNIGGFLKSIGFRQVDHLGRIFQKDG